MTTKLTPVQLKITEQIAQYQVSHGGKWPSVVEVAASEKREVEHFLGGSFIRVEVKNEQRTK